MAKGNFNNQSKRNREAAKKDKRAAKDEKRAQKKAEARAARAATEGAPPWISVPVAVPTPPPNVRSVASSAVAKWMSKKPSARR
jgi:hypothetical protein